MNEPSSNALFPIIITSSTEKPTKQSKTNQYDIEYIYPSNLSIE